MMVIEMKNIPNLITITRIVGTAVLIFMKPFSKLFFIVYFICGISDILDGMVARKMNFVSKNGQILDSVADFFMVIVLLFILVPKFKFQLWCIYWIAVIAAIRITSLVVGFIRYKELVFLHTYSNKFTGMVLFCFPVMYTGLGLHIAAILVCFIASSSAVEELIINIFSKRLCRDIESICSIKSI